MAGLDTVDELHWLLGVIQHVDVGIIVLDHANQIRLWNEFMENHSGKAPQEVAGKELFSAFPDLPQQWLQRKIDTVVQLNNRSFSTWQQRPYLFRFKSYRSITGASEWMYQNVTLFPLKSVNGKVEHVCIVIYDVTETALDELALNRANEELERISRSDTLTGLYNRSAWEELLIAEYKRHLRNGQKGGLAMIDIDHFRDINERYGHPAGDEVIRTVARLLNELKRVSDIAGRLGGEQFGIVLPDTELDGCLRFAERVRETLENCSVQFEGHTIRFTASIGVALLDKENIGYNLWLDRAEKALLQAKSGGRNRVSPYFG